MLRGRTWYWSRWQAYWSCSWHREYYFGRDLAVESTVCILILTMRVTWFGFDVEGTDLVLVGVKRLGLDLGVESTDLSLILVLRVLTRSWSRHWDYCLGPSPNLTYTLSCYSVFSWSWTTWPMSSAGYTKNATEWLNSSRTCYRWCRSETRTSTT